jgi:hypothetical protein
VGIRKRNSFLDVAKTAMTSGGVSVWSPEKRAEKPIHRSRGGVTLVFS